MKALLREALTVAERAAAERTAAERAAAERAAAERAAAAADRAAAAVDRSAAERERAAAADLLAAASAERAAAERAAAERAASAAEAASASKARRECIPSLWPSRAAELQTLSAAAAAAAAAQSAYGAAALPAERRVASLLLREEAALAALSEQGAAAEAAARASAAAARALDEARRAARAAAPGAAPAAELRARCEAEAAALAAALAAAAAFDALAAAQRARAGELGALLEAGAAPEAVPPAELRRRAAALPGALAAVDRALARAAEATQAALETPGGAAALQAEAAALAALREAAECARGATAAAAAASAAAAAGDASAANARAAAAEAERYRAAHAALQQQLSAAGAARAAAERKAAIKEEYKAVNEKLKVLRRQKEDDVDNEAWSEALEAKFAAKEADLKRQLADLVEQTRALEPALSNEVLKECFPELLQGGAAAPSELSDAHFTRPEVVAGTRNIFCASWAGDPAAPPVCLKVFPRAGASKEFQQESRRMKSLDAHPLLIRLLHSYVRRGSGDGVLVMPFYPAGNLRGWFEQLAAKRGQLSPAEWAAARRVLRQLLHALSFLHARGIAHRDVKPENLLWSDAAAGSILVADFGISRDLNRQLETTRLLGAGTVGYAAPEVNTPQWKAVPWAADMWAVGVMALHIASGQMFCWNAARPGLVCAQSGEPFSQSPHAGAAARELALLALSCLSVEPSERPSADEALQTAFFAGAEAAASDAAGSHGPGSELAPALAAKLGLLCASLRDLRGARKKSDAGWPLELPPGDGQLCSSLLAAVVAAAPADLLRPWVVRLARDEAPLASAMRSFWAALPAAALLERREPGAALDLPYLPRAGADRGQLAALGRVLAKCLLDGIAVEVEFAPTAYAALLDRAEAAMLRPGTALAHLAAFDADRASTHRSTLSTRLGAGSALLTAGAYLGNEDETPLSDANKALLVCANARLLLLESRAAELSALKRGFDELVRAAGIEPALAQLSEWELGAQLSGASGFVDRADIRRRVVWADDWPADEPQRAWLDALLSALSGPALQLLLARAAERVRLPSGGPSFTVLRGREDEAPRLLGGGVLQLPATCPSYDTFCARLLQALGLDDGAVNGRIMAVYSCDVCLTDNFLPAGGIACSAEHFTCNGCLVDLVRSQCSDDPFELVERKGQAVCSLCPRDAPPFSSATLAQRIPDAVFAQLHTATVRATEAATTIKLENQYQARLREMERRLGENASVAQLRQHVAENILTLHCPACTQAFVDFNGCFALTCSRCNAGFCAWCLAHCGNDAHAHVAQCAHNTSRGKDVFGTEASFLAAQRQRSVRLLKAFLEAQAPAIRAPLLRELTADLRPLGIDAATFG